MRPKDQSGTFQPVRLVSFEHFFLLLIPGTLLLAMLTACSNGHEGPAVCIAGTTCDTANPCTRGQVVCGADDHVHCVVQEVVPDCPAEPPGVCVAGATCDTASPCARGQVVCGADDRAHCVVNEIEPGCPSAPPGTCVAGSTCDTANPCLRGEYV